MVWPSSQSEMCCMRLAEIQDAKIAKNSPSDAHYCMPCSNAAMRNPLKCAGVPQTLEPISAVSAPKFTILCCLTSFFSDCRYVAIRCRISCEDAARQSCTMVPRWRRFGDFFASCIFSEPPTVHFRPAF